MASVENEEEARAAAAYFRKPYKPPATPKYNLHKPAYDPYKFKSPYEKPYKQTAKGILNRILLFMGGVLGLMLGGATIKVVPLLGIVLGLSGITTIIISLIPEKWYGLDGMNYY